jgi:hypothetical protein
MGLVARFAIASWAKGITGEGVHFRHPCAGRGPAPLLWRLEIQVQQQESKSLGDAPLLRLALWAIRVANVRFGFLPSQSCLRRNDERRMNTCCWEVEANFRPYFDRLSTNGSLVGAQDRLGSRRTKFCSHNRRAEPAQRFPPHTRTGFQDRRMRDRRIHLRWIRPTKPIPRIPRLLPQKSCSPQLFASSLSTGRSDAPQSFMLSCAFPGRVEGKDEPP